MSAIDKILNPLAAVSTGFFARVGVAKGENALLANGVLDEPLIKRVISEDGVESGGTADAAFYIVAIIAWIVFSIISKKTGKMK